MRWIVAIALLLAFAGVGHAADELPAAGASLTLKPTPSGYEARMNLPPKKFVGARISSTDSILAPLLQMKEWKEDADPAHASAPPANGTPLKVLTVTLASGQIPQGQYPVSLSLIGGDAPETRDFFLVVPAAKVDPIETAGRLSRPVGRRHRRQSAADPGELEQAVAHRPVVSPEGQHGRRRGTGRTSCR